MSCLQNIKVDALTAFATTLALSINTSYCLMAFNRHLFCLKYSLEISEVHTTLTNMEAPEVIKEAHDGICGAHQSSPKLKD